MSYWCLDGECFSQHGYIRFYVNLLCNLSNIEIFFLPNRSMSKLNSFPRFSSWNKDGSDIDNITHGASYIIRDQTVWFVIGSYIFSVMQMRNKPSSVYDKLQRMFSNSSEFQQCNANILVCMNVLNTFIYINIRKRYIYFCVLWI